MQKLRSTKGRRTFSYLKMGNLTPESDPGLRAAAGSPRQQTQPAPCPCAFDLWSDNSRFGFCYYFCPWKVHTHRRMNDISVTLVESLRFKEMQILTKALQEKAETQNACLRFHTACCTSRPNFPAHHTGVTRLFPNPVWAKELARTGVTMSGVSRELLTLSCLSSPSLV